MTGPTESSASPPQPRVIEEGIVLLAEPLPFGPGSTNAYLILGPPPVLIDSGLNAPGALNRLADRLHGLGIHPRDIAHVFLTHAHTDHAGTCMALAAEFGARIWAHPAENPRLNGEQYTFLTETLPRILARLGMERGEIDEVLKGLQGAFWAYRGQRLSTIEALHDGQRLPIPDFQIEVMHTPGHTPGSVCFVDRLRGIVFGGDTLLPWGAGQAAMSPQDDQGAPLFDGVLALEQSIRRLETVPGRLLLGGHGRPVEFGRAAARALSGLRGKRAAVLEALTVEATPSDLTRKLYPDGASLGLVMELGEIRAVLEALLQDGLVGVTASDGVEFFRRA